MADRSSRVAVVVRRLRLGRSGLALAFYAWFRDDPAEHPGTNKAKRQLITARRVPGEPVSDSEDGHGADRAISEEVIDGPIPWDRVIAAQTSGSWARS